MKKYILIGFTILLSVILLTTNFSEHKKSSNTKSINNNSIIGEESCSATICSRTGKQYSNYLCTDGTFNQDGSPYIIDRSLCTPSLVDVEKSCTAANCT